MLMMMILYLFVKQFNSMNIIPFSPGTYQYRCSGGGVCVCVCENELLLLTDRYSDSQGFSKYVEASLRSICLS